MLSAVKIHYPRAASISTSIWLKNVIIWIKEINAEVILNSVGLVRFKIQKNKFQILLLIVQLSSL